MDGARDPRDDTPDPEVLDPESLEAVAGGGISAEGFLVVGNISLN